MTAIVIFVGIVAVVISTFVLVVVPVRHVDAVARDFPWRRSVRIGTRAWVRKGSKRQPKASIDIRNVRIQNADDPKKRRYTYEARVWRNMRRVTASGLSHATVRDPEYELGRNEEVRGKEALYQARFVSEESRHYSAKMRLTRWTSLKAGRKYRLGRNTFGRVRTIKPAKPAIKRHPSEHAQGDSEANSRRRG
jgi:hypothetical protein